MSEINPIDASSHIFLDPNHIDPNQNQRSLSPDESQWAKGYWENLVHQEGYTNFSDAYGVIKQREAEGAQSTDQSVVLFAQYRSNLLNWLSQIAPFT